MKIRCCTLQMTINSMLVQLCEAFGLKHNQITNPAVACVHYRCLTTCWCSRVTRVRRVTSSTGSASVTCC
jgi:hypothetical protein